LEKSNVVNRSLLVRRRVPPETEPAHGTVIVLHGDNGGLDDLVPLAQSLSPHLEVVAAEAPRRVFNREAVVHTWFSIQEPARPEPVSFGDSLAQLEQFVYDIAEERREQSVPVYLLGYDQGALMALSICMVVPDYLSGVVAISGCLPQIALWPLPDRSLDSLPVLLVYDPEDSQLPAELVETTGDELVKRGGVPTLSAVVGARELGSTVLVEVKHWLGEKIK
jgi:phospholipase/carboxylesterase